MWTGWTQVHPRLTFFLWWDFLLGNAAKWSCLSEYNQGLWQGLLNLWTRWNMQIKFQYSIEKWISVQLEQVSILENESLSVVFNSLRPHGLYSPWNSLDQNIGVGSLSLLQRIFRTLWLNQGLPHGRQIFSYPAVRARAAGQGSRRQGRPPRLCRGPAGRAATAVSRLGGALESE